MSTTNDKQSEIIENCADQINNNVKAKQLKFPYEISFVDEETTRQLLLDFTGERTAFVQVGPKKYFFPNEYLKNASSIYNFPVREDDIWVATFPRSGTTWTQEMVWLMCNNLDYEEAARVPLLQRVPFFEYSLFVHPQVKSELLEENKHDAAKLKIVQDMDLPMWNELQKVSGRRIIKTHLPFSLLPAEVLTSGCKVIYVARNPKDVSVSFYHLNRLMRTQGYQNDWPTYWEYFSKNLRMSIDECATALLMIYKKISEPWTPYWEHIKEGYEQHSNPNVLFMFYEDMVKDARRTLHKLSDFLDAPLNAADLDKLEDHLHIRNFRNNKSVNFDMLANIGVFNAGEEGFIRTGKIGMSDNQFDDEDLCQKYEDWLDWNRKNVIDIKFPVN